MGLELYAEIEPLLGFDEEVRRLYGVYLDVLESWKPRRLIDIGCGNGAFLAEVVDRLRLERGYGVDLSETMVARARERGVEAEAVDLCDVDGTFDAATAVFDVLNYLPPEALPRFLECVADVLEKGGVFVADVNTLFGFEEVAPGTLVRETPAGFLCLDAEFDGRELLTRIDFFEKEEGERYRRRSDTIRQYYHPVESIARMCERLELSQSYPVAMYGEDADKELLLFRKR